MPERVVFDCNVYFQALISPKGPAGACLSAAQQGHFQLFVTDYVIQELTEVCSRPHLADRFGFTPERLSQFSSRIRKVAEVVGEIPHVFDYERDPDDEHYVDLAVACTATLIASRDKDLLALSDQSTAIGRDFRERFPDLEIIEPVELLTRLGRRE
jgi:putative PIN family toxin of toxin-antitoxin system